MWIVLLLNLACFVAVKGEERKICFAPGVCSVGETSTSEWLEFDPKRYCTNKYSAEMNEMKVKKLIEEYSGVIRSHNEKVAYSLFNITEKNINELHGELEKLNNTLRQDLKEVLAQVTNATDSLNNETNKKMEELEKEMEDLNKSFSKNAENLQSELINFTDSKFKESTERLRELQARLDILNSTSEQNFNLIRSHFENLTRFLFNKTSEKITEIQREQEKRKTSEGDVICKDVNGTFYLGKCYWLILQSKSSVNLGRAETLCAAQGGELGDVLDGFHYKMIEGMAQATMPTASHTSAWTGMIYNPQTKVLTTSGGKVTTYKKWRTTVGFPLTAAVNTGIMLEIYKNSTSNNGMSNYRPSIFSRGALCQN